MATEIVFQNNPDNDEDEDFNIVANGTNDLMCAFCFKDKRVRNVAVGICKDCKCYLCHECLKAHHKDDVKLHRVAYFFCAQKIRVNKKVRATSFCLDCGHFLCHKCVLDHPGFRMYRHHTFIGDSTAAVQTLTAENLNARALATRSDRRNLQSRMTKRSEKSSKVEKPMIKAAPPTRSAPERIFTRKEKSHRQISIEDSFVRQRTLIQSTTGNRLNTSSGARAREKLTNTRKKPKTVRVQEAAKPANLLGEYGCSVPDDEEPCHVISSIFLGNNYLVFADIANRKIKCTGSDFVVTATMSLDPFPVALCPSETNNAEFYASAGNAVYKIGTESNLEVLQTIRTNVDAVEGITTWSSGVAIVFRSSKSKLDKKGHLEVHLLSVEGEVKFEIIVSGPFAVKQLTPIWYIATIDNGNKIIISDTFNNRLICVDVISWHVVYVLKGKDADGAPRSLTVDADDNLLVTWYNEVHSISQTGTDLGVPVSDVDKESVIAFNKTSGQLVVFGGNPKMSNVFNVFNVL